MSERFAQLEDLRATQIRIDAADASELLAKARETKELLEELPRTVKRRIIWPVGTSRQPVALIEGDLVHTNEVFQKLLATDTRKERGAPGVYVHRTAENAAASLGRRIEDLETHLAETEDELAKTGARRQFIQEAATDVDTISQPRAGVRKTAEGFLEIVENELPADDEREVAPRTGKSLFRQRRDKARSGQDPEGTEPCGKEC